MEQAHVHDGVQSPALDSFRYIAKMPDARDGEFKALYALRHEFQRMAALSQ
jgi:hypothetical protein